MAATAVAPSYAALGSAPAQHPYTCNTCQVAFRGSELQRSHMQSDWHRYNLKRRVASLPPLTSEIFAEKVLANQASAAATAARASFEKICTACQRTYFSENAYQNHLGSQKHRTRMVQLQSAPGSVVDSALDDETGSMMSSTFSLGGSVDTTVTPLVEDHAVEKEFSQIVDGLQQTTVEEEDVVSERPSRPHHSSNEQHHEHPLSATTSESTTAGSSSTAPSESKSEEDVTKKCLFCNLLSPTIDSNAAHMKSKHGMFIPEKAYLVDMEGLIRWLYDRVNSLHECLYCGMLKHTTSGIQTHMRDKGHCMIAFESEMDMVEVGEFYDFRSTYSDDEDDEEEDEAEPAAGGVRLGAKRRAQVVLDGEESMDVDAEGDEDGWEDDNSGEEEVDDDDDTSVADSDRTSRPRRSNLAYQDDFELHLPSGRTAGHRSLAMYYRQNLHNYPTPAERAARLAITGGGADPQDEAQSDRGRQVVSRANGGLGLANASDQLKKEARAIELKDRRRQQRVAAQYQWGNNKRANMQKHFRDPLLQ